MGKNIVICCDGTANQFGRDNTNVVKLYEMMVVDSTQANFYDPGVGTSSRAMLLPFRWLNNKLSQGLGLDLHRNVEDAYGFLMNTYEEGDRIFLFGFSRGAHTARRLADVLGKLGLLYRGSDNMIPYVLRMYERDEDPEIIKAFRITYTNRCPVHFLGVWDTVSALSRLIPRSKLDGELNPEIAFAYHAVAIDEQRLQFPPNLFKAYSSHQTVEEVWFAGVHSDVGGSYPETGLSNIALKWMAEKAVAQGLKVFPDSLNKIVTNPQAPQHESWRGLFYFVPWHVYILLGLAAIAVGQGLLAFLDLFFDLPYRPLTSILTLLYENWIFTLLAIIGTIPFTRMRRVIPEGAKVHISVKEHSEKIKSKAAERMADHQIHWVD